MPPTPVVVFFVAFFIVDGNVVSFCIPPHCESKRAAVLVVWVIIVTHPQAPHSPIHLHRGSPRGVRGAFFSVAASAMPTLTLKPFFEQGATIANNRRATTFGYIYDVAFRVARKNAFWK